MRQIGVLLFISLTIVSHVEAKTVAAIALFNDRAMLSVDGNKAKIILAGSTYRGVKVISSTTSEAVIEVEGRRETLRLNGTAVLGANLGLSSKKPITSVVLYQNDIGFFESNGQVNGRSTRFLVDTGANLVVFSSHQAERLGIDYLTGKRGYATTASGQANMYLINIELVSLGGIVLKDIGAGVIEGGFPLIPLLGMTFLSRLDMSRSGQTMELKTR